MVLRASLAFFANLEKKRETFLHDQLLVWLRSKLMFNNDFFFSLSLSVFYCLSLILIFLAWRNGRTIFSEAESVQNGITIRCDVVNGWIFIRLEFLQKYCIQEELSRIAQLWRKPRKKERRKKLYKRLTHSLSERKFSLHFPRTTFLCSAD